MAPSEPIHFRSPASARADWAPFPWAAKLAWIGLALVVHGLLLAAVGLLPTSAPIVPPAPVTVEIIEAAAPRPVAQPQSHPHAAPKPQPVQKPAVAPVAVTRQASPSAPTAQTQPTPAPAAPSPPSSAAAKTAEAAPAPITAPRFDAAYLNNPPPPYPSLAKRLGETGTVKLRVHVLPSGSADAIEIQSPSGSPRLDRAALETVRQWRFIPARQGDEAIAQWVIVPVSFKLEN